MTTLRVRTFQSNDLSAVVRIWNTALPRNPINEIRFTAWLLGDPDCQPGPDCGFFVATDQDMPVGFARAVIRHCPNDRLGLEPDTGWIPVLAVAPPHQRRGVGGALLETVLAYLQRHGRRRVWVCGTPPSCPGSVVPGVDVEAWPAALRLFARAGFVHDQYGYSMARDVVDFAWAGQGAAGADVAIGTPTVAQAHDLLAFVAEALPGSWALAARAKIRAGEFHEMLLAGCDGQMLGYCQWSGEHFGPFGVGPAARNRGVGARLFAAAVERIRQAGGRRVWFNWADENARRFYERFGLHVTRRFAILQKDL
ncbi:MAG: GNAT family N-acetyltransferase [Phycisphaerae bacterium]|nr:GNAT family N-acetyltransferase [Phycisphaerae bacterium]